MHRDLNRCAVAIFGALLATSATAQVTTDPTGPVAPHAEQVDSIDAQIEAFVNEAPPVNPVSPVVVRSRRVVLDDSPWGQGLYTTVAPGLDAASAMATPSAAPPVGPRQLHGEVSAAVGSHGLRAASGVVAIPVGDDATVVLAVSSAHLGR